MQHEVTVSATISATTSATSATHLQQFCNKRNAIIPIL